MWLGCVYVDEIVADQASFLFTQLVGARGFAISFYAPEPALRLTSINCMTLMANL